MTLKLTGVEGEQRAPGSPSAMGTTSTYEIQLWSGLADAEIIPDESADFPDPDRGTSGRAVFRACDQRRTDLYREVDQELALEARCVKAVC